MKVIGRKSEIGQIRKLYDSGKSEFVVVYGRRRVGKTFLVNQFFDNKFLFKVTGLAVKDKAAQLVNFGEALEKTGLAPLPLPEILDGSVWLLEDAYRKFKGEWTQGRVH